MTAAGEKIITGLKEALAISRGEIEPAKVHIRLGMPAVVDYTLPDNMIKLVGATTVTYIMETDCTKEGWD